MVCQWKEMVQQFHLIHKLDTEQHSSTWPITFTSQKPGISHSDSMPCPLLAAPVPMEEQVVTVQQEQGLGRTRPHLMFCQAQSGTNSSSEILSLEFKNWPQHLDYFSMLLIKIISLFCTVIVVVTYLSLDTTKWYSWHQLSTWPFRHNLFWKLHTTNLTGMLPMQLRWLEKNSKYTFLSQPIHFFHS